MPSARAAALALALLATPAMAFAGTIADAGKDAEKLNTIGKPREAFDMLSRARDQIWKTAPLSFDRALFVAAEPQGYGVYDARPGNVFKAGETMYVYAEPFGFGYGSQGDLRRIQFEVSISVTTPAGETAVAPQSGKLELSSRVENKEYMVSLAYEPKGLQPGDYVLQIDARDPNTGKTAIIRLPFKVA
jgi:hypothetical protein